MIHFHKYVPVSARHRSQPVFDSLTHLTGKFVDGVVIPQTDVLYRCQCGKVKAESLDGYWRIEDITGAGTAPKGEGK